MNPKVSIIVPCYGVEKYLDRCLETLVNQTLKDIEIILIDDESPDRVPEMCEEWAIKDSRIKVIHKKNGGLGFARNSGLDIASGEYIAFVDSDDFVELDMYEKLYNEAKRSDADAVFSNTFVENWNGTWTRTQEVIERTQWVGSEVIRFLLDMIACEPSIPIERRFQMSVWHSIYNGRIIRENNIRFHSERDIVCEDFPFQVDFIKQCKKVVYLPDSFYHYCKNGSSLSHTFKVDKIDKIYELYKLFGEQLKGIDGAQERIDRFYIGFARSLVKRLLLSSVDDKKDWAFHACDLIKDTGIQQRYPVNSMRLDRRLFFNWMISHNYMALYLMSKMNG